MDILEQANMAINLNPNLSDGLKDNFRELISIFHSNFKEVRLDNFCDRMRTVRVVKGNKYLVKDAVAYLPKENVIYLNLEKLEQADARHSLMKIILMMVTSKENYYGLGKSGKLEALNVGLTEMLANFLVGNESDEQEYLDEVVFANLVGGIVDGE